MPEIRSKQDPAKMIREHVDRAEKGMATHLRQWRDDWRQYRSYIDMSGRDTTRSNMFIPIVFPLIETAVARYILGLFSSEPIISVIPRSSASLDAAFARELVMQYYLERPEMAMFGNFAEIARLLLIMGDGWALHSWDTITRKVKKPAPVIEMGLNLGNRYEEVEEVVYDGPVMEAFPSQQILPDMDAHSVDDSEWIVIEDFVPRKKLEEMEKQGRVYDIDKIPNGATTSMQARFDFWSSVGYSAPTTGEDDDQVLRWRAFSDEHFITIANGEMVIFDDDNPHTHGMKPLSQYVKTPQPQSFFSMSAVAPVRRLQHAINTLFDQAMDHNNMVLNPITAYDAREGGVDPYRLISMPGASIPTSGPPSQALYIHQMQSLSFNILEMMNYVKNAFDESTGFFGMQRGDEDTKQTATVGSILNQQGDMRIRSDVMTTEEFGLKRSARLLGADIEQFMPDEVEVALTRGSERLFVRLTPDQIRGEFGYSFEGPASAFNRDTDRAQILEMLNLVFQNPNVNQREFLDALFDMFPSLRIRKQQLLAPEMGNFPNPTLGQTGALTAPGQVNPPTNQMETLAQLRGAA